MHATFDKQQAAKHAAPHRPSPGAAAIKAQFTELCFLAASLPPIWAARRGRQALQSIAYFCVGLTTLLLWEAQLQVRPRLHCQPRVAWRGERGASVRVQVAPLP